MRLNMAIFFLLGVHPDALKIAAAASSLFSWPQQRDAPRMSEVLLEGGVSASDNPPSLRGI